MWSFSDLIRPSQIVVNGSRKGIMFVSCLVMADYKNKSYKQGKN